MNKNKIIIKEFCAENFTDIPKAITAGAKRIELCDNLAEGGLTPSYGVIKKTMTYATTKNESVMVMIRPRKGDFEYSLAEKEMMLDDISVCSKLGVTGVVFGCLKDEWIDEKLVGDLIKASRGMDVTFHMAFDLLDKSKQFQAIDWLSKMGVSRVLTHGGSSNSCITENFVHLGDLIRYAKDKLIILPGAGITYKNVDEIVRSLNVFEVHGTQIVNLRD